MTKKQFHNFGLKATLILAVIGAGIAMAHPKDFYRKPDFQSGSKLAENEISVKWFGTAAFRVEHRGAVLWIDPYFSRHGLFKVMRGAPLEPRGDEISRYMDRADWIVIGHSHFDHAADLPYIVPKTGATVIGSRSTGNLFRAYGLAPDKFRQVTGGDSVTAGPFKVNLIKSEHGKVMGRIPYNFDISPTAKPPFRAKDFGCGEVFGIIVEAAGYRIYHHGSGGFIEETLRGTRAEMALLGVSSRSGTPRFVYRVVKELQPKVIIPTHYDYFFRPLDKKMRLVPNLKFSQVAREAREAAPNAEFVTLPLLGEYRVKLK